MRVDVAHSADIPQWLKLAAEVEWLFGPMVNEPGFHRALANNIGRRTAFCIREADGPPGSPLIGALLFRTKDAPDYTINWLSVGESWRRRGVGRQLVEHVFTLIKLPATISVITFGAAIVGGEPARALYERMGFQAAEPAPNGSDGGSRQVFRRTFNNPSDLPE